MEGGLARFTAKNMFGHKLDDVVAHARANIAEGHPELVPPLVRQLADLPIEVFDSDISRYHDALQQMEVQETSGLRGELQVLQTELADVRQQLVAFGNPFLRLAPDSPKVREKLLTKEAQLAARVDQLSEGLEGTARVHDEALTSITERLKAEGKDGPLARQMRLESRLAEVQRMYRDYLTNYREHPDLRGGFAWQTAVPGMMTPSGLKSEETAHRQAELLKAEKELRQQFPDMNQVFTPTWLGQGIGSATEALYVLRKNVERGIAAPEVEFSDAVLDVESPNSRPLDAAERKEKKGEEEVKETPAQRAERHARIVQRAAERSWDTEIGKRRAAERDAAAGEHDEAGQLVAFATEAVTHPRTGAGISAQREAGVQEVIRLGMFVANAGHRTDDREVVGAGADVRKQLTDGKAGLTVALELPGRRHDVAVLVEHRAVDGDGHGLAGVLDEAGLGVEGIDVGDAAGHVAEDDVFDFGGEVGFGLRQAGEGQGAEA
jgi:hypothetical protein